MPNKDSWWKDFENEVTTNTTDNKSIVDEVNPFSPTYLNEGFDLKKELAEKKNRKVNRD